MSSTWLPSVLHATGRRDKAEENATEVSPVGLTVRYAAETNRDTWISGEWRSSWRAVTHSG